MADSRVGCGARRVIFLRSFVSLLGLVVQNWMTFAFHEEIPREGIIFERTGRVGTDFCCDVILGFDGVMWFPFLLRPDGSEMMSDVIGSWSWTLITIVLASISKVSLF